MSRKKEKQPEPPVYEYTSKYCKVVNGVVVGLDWKKIERKQRQIDTLINKPTKGMMKNTYRLEMWRYHMCREKMIFTNKAKAQKWLKESGWWEMYDYGECMIYVYINDIKQDYDIVNKEWRRY